MRNFVYCYYGVDNDGEPPDIEAPNLEGYWEPHTVSFTETVNAETGLVSRTCHILWRRLAHVPRAERARVRAEKEAPTADKQHRRG